MTLDRFRSANRIHWDEKAEFNLKTWDVDGFLADPGKLSRSSRPTGTRSARCAADR